MKKLLLATLLLFSITAFSQTSKELIGKWKLVKQTQNGIEKTPKETYQVFKENGDFVGINGDKSRNGKWKLSKDNKNLKIGISIVKINFSILYFDANKRIISSPETGTLEYEKVNEL